MIIIIIILYYIYYRMFISKWHSSQGNRRYMRSVRGSACSIDHQNNTLWTTDGPEDAVLTEIAGDDVGDFAVGPEPVLFARDGPLGRVAVERLAREVFNGKLLILRQDYITFEVAGSVREDCMQRT